MRDYALVVEPGYLDHGTEAGLLSAVGLELRRLSSDIDDRGRDQQLAGAKILFVRDTRFDAQALGKCLNALGLIRYGVGVDGIDLSAARERRIAVANIPDYGADIEVADHTLALYLAVARRIVTRDGVVRNGVWGIGQAEPIRRIAGQTLGLVGYGRIARAVHCRFVAFGIEEVLVHDPFLAADAAAASGVTRVDLAELASRADIVSLHAPGGEPAKPLVDRYFLARMKADAILINTARGSHIDEQALAEALSAGRLSGAALDVMLQEPPARDNPLLSLPNVVVSDHAGWYSEATVATLQQRAGEEAVRIMRGERPRNWANPW